MGRTIEARLISTSGPGKEAVLEIDGSNYVVADGFSWSAEHSPKVGQVFDVELLAILAENESWETKFSGNPQHRIGFESLGSWSYKAMGRVASVDPVSIDCGILVESRAIHTTDPSVIGEFVAFTIVCLEACGSKISN